MPRIHPLSDLLVNKIAAGEVIERPGSVVKELVENSLDAGARRIEISLEQGGRKLISVSDDGHGMDAEDLARCILPHATSKITREEDLFAIRTMGFRGEALPSIGSVSQLQITSRTADSDAAHQVSMVGQKVEPLTAAARPVGTTVEVRQLFFNVPARLKFLRTAQTELGHITEQIARVALARTDVEFRILHNGREVQHLRATGDLRSRIADLFGAELAASLLDFTRSERGLEIRGFAGHPADSRSSAKWQYILLNGRYIRDRFIAHATREAYRGLMEAHRQPVFFITLQVDPATVDVNVHPTKIEVRWQDSSLVYSQVLSCLRDRFLTTNLSPRYQGASAAPASQTTDAGLFGSDAAAPHIDSADEEAQADIEATRRQQVRQSVADFFRRHPAGSPGPSSGPFSGHRPSYSGYGTPPAAAPADSPPTPRPIPPADPGQAAALQIHDCFLVTQTPDGIEIIDQHALHERILYEQFSAQLAGGSLESQRLLLPETLDVTPDQIELIESHGALFKQLGFELGAYGPSAIAVHATPSLLRPERVNAFLRDALDRLSDRQTPASAEMLLNDFVSMMACKAAVKAGDHLCPEEIQALLARRHQVHRSSNCPHGRPTSLILTLSDLERQFKRT